MTTQPSNPIADLLRAARGLGDASDRRALTALGGFALLSAAQNGVDVSPRGLHRTLRAMADTDPAGALGVTVLGGAYLFFLAEKGTNPKVTSYWDALVFVSTSLSVGYADVFARTPAGKAIASALMTFGPALSGVGLEAPKREGASGAGEEALAVQQAILGKLGEVLRVMEGGEGARTGHHR